MLPGMSKAPGPTSLYREGALSSHFERFLLKWSSILKDAFFLTGHGFSVLKTSINEQSLCTIIHTFHLRKRIALSCIPEIILVQFITYWALVTQVVQSVLMGHCALKVELLTSCLLAVFKLKSSPNFATCC